MLSYNAYISESQDTHSLKNALFVNDYELNNIGKNSLELLGNSNLSELHNELAWLVQAAWEFSDMQGGQVLKNDLWKRQGYCFFESLHTMRESILAGINGHFTLSIGGLRSVVELILLHLYWESNKETDSELLDFENWIFGKVSKLPFKRLLLNVNNKFNIPSEMELVSNVGILYGKLCSYAHTPILKESFTSIKRTNISYANENVLRYWLVHCVETLKCILNLLIVCYPMSLFPVNLVLKFGFSPPVGLFFDETNVRPILRCISSNELKNLRDFFRCKDGRVRHLIEWYNDHKDLTLDQIKQTWSKEDRHKAEYKRLKKLTSLEDSELEILIFSRRIEVRAIQLMFIYSDL
ncbi:hypothetical protein ACMX2M_01135 [Paenibacillus polymyxa]